MVTVHNMSEAIICNHAALNIPKEKKWINVPHNEILPRSDSLSSNVQ